MSVLAILAYFAVFTIGLVTCFKDAKLSLITRKSDGLTVFEKRAYVLKAVTSFSLALLAIGGLFIAIQGA